MITKNVQDIIKFASMWNMDGLVSIGFCHQDYMYLRNHMRIPFVVYDGFCAGFGDGTADLMLIPMHKEERWDFYRRQIEKFRSISAVFAVSDYYAIDLIRFLKESGIRVPEDLSVAGFDDIPMCEMISPTLTTVKQDNAIQKLQEMKTNKENATEIILPVTLVERASTKKINC